MKTTVTHALTFMFKDDDWFWKVSLGALALLLIGTGVGYILCIGYHVETVRRCRNQEPQLPDWNDLRLLWRAGRVVGCAILLYCAAVLGCLAAVHQARAFYAGIAVLAVHTCIQPFVVLRYLDRGTMRSCFAIGSFAAAARRNGLRALGMTGAGFGIVGVVVCFGWMALIVGWPFFIFWGMLAAAAFTASLAPSSDISEAAAL